MKIKEEKLKDYIQNKQNRNFNNNFTYLTIHANKYTVMFVQIHGLTNMRK